MGSEPELAPLDPVAKRARTPLTTPLVTGSLEENESVRRPRSS